MTRRPSFAAEFPRDPALDDLVEAFAGGNYRRVRLEAPRLERTSADPAVRAAARVLVERTSADPLATWLFFLAALLLLVVGGYWMLYGKPPSERAPPPPSARPVEHVT